MNSTAAWTRTLGVAALTALVPFAFVACGGGHPPAPGEQPAAVTAALARAERQELPRLVTLRGSVEASRAAAVSSRVMAAVTAVHVRAGDRVRRGQPLVDIDPQAAGGQLSQAQGALAQARAALSMAERNHERFTALAADNAASQLELDQATMQRDQARGAVEQAEGAVAAAAAVAGDARVVAPFDGRVVRRLVEVGDLAAPGRPLLMLESEGGRRLAVPVPESTAVTAGLAPGSTVEVALDSRPGLGTLTGTVVEMTPGADPQTHSFEVKVELPEEGVPTGSAGRARVPVGMRSAVVVPAAAVHRQGGIVMVVLRDAEGRAATRVVTLGETLDDGRLEVLSGLAGGETVLTGLSMLPPAGAPVEAVEGVER